MEPSGPFDQSAIFAFLADPATHRIVTPVKQIDTHGAAIFLVGQTAYKVKRAVCFPYMDFSTLEKRKAACEAEISVNRDNAPELYLGVLPITREGAKLCIGGSGEPIEWVVQMRRFDENATLDKFAEHGTLDAAIIDRLAQVLTDAYRKAPLRAGAPAIMALEKTVSDTLLEMESQSAVFQRDITGPLRAGLGQAWHAGRPLMACRANTGKVRRCHGDLHLRNILLRDGVPILFDAIEFDESIAEIDILYDLAFLIMDLCERGLNGLACRLLNRYLWLCDDEAGEIEGLALLPLFLALRAAIRAKVMAAQSDLAAEPCARRRSHMPWPHCAFWRHRLPGLSPLVACQEPARAAWRQPWHRIFVKSRPTATPPETECMPLVVLAYRLFQRGHGWTRNATSSIPIFRNEINALGDF